MNRQRPHQVEKIFIAMNFYKVGKIQLPTTWRALVVPLSQNQWWWTCVGKLTCLLQPLFSADTRKRKSKQSPGPGFLDWWRGDIVSSPPPHLPQHVSPESIQGNRFVEMHHEVFCLRLWWRSSLAGGRRHQLNDQLSFVAFVCFLFVWKLSLRSINVFLQRARRQ